jgi:hypothetical protein
VRICAWEREQEEEEKARERERKKGKRKAQRQGESAGTHNDTVVARVRHDLALLLHIDARGGEGAGLADPRLAEEGAVWVRKASQKGERVGGHGKRTKRVSWGRADVNER